MTLNREVTPRGEVTRRLENDPKRGGELKPNKGKRESRLKAPVIGENNLKRQIETLVCDHKPIPNSALKIKSDPNPKPETNAQAYKPQLNKPDRGNIWGLSQSNSALYKYYPNPSPNLNWPPHHAPCDKDYGVGIYVYKLLG